MSDDDAFVAAVTESPDDTVLRLVYADWLDERDDPRGRFLRLELEAVERGEVSPELAALAATLDFGWRLAVSRVPADAGWVPAADRVKPVVWPDATEEWLEEQLRQQLITEDEPRQQIGRRWVWAYGLLLISSLLFLLYVARIFVRHPNLLR